MKKIMSSCALALSLATLGAAPGLAQDDHFDIVRFQIDGNTLLPEAEVQGAVAPQVGPKRVYGDVQKALEALEGVYRRAGFSTVQVYVPEQELTGGVVRLQVTEGVIGKVLISGNQRFDDANIRASLPALKEGRAPNLRQMSEEIQLSNENPAKQIEVTLGVSEEEGKVDAKVAVAEENPQRVYGTIDSTGTAATGVSRVGVAYQNANLFHRDETLTLAYTTSADAPSAVKVDIFSVGYRVPLYAFGDSLDFIYGKSGVNTPSATPVLNGMLGIVGKGDVFGARWNHYFARRGEYSSKLVYGFDYKHINSRCTIVGNPESIEPNNPIAFPAQAWLNSACLPYTTRPLSLTYSAQRQSPGRMFDYNIGIARNLELGTHYINRNGASDRYSYLTSGNRPTRDDFSIVRMGGSYLKAFQSDWQVRVAASGQYAGNPVVGAEQLGLAGSTAVRGFTERAAASDSGYFANTEIYSPELSKATGAKGSLRVLAFYDFAYGYNHNVPASFVNPPPTNISIASAGAGVRYTLGKDFSLRFDLAQVVDAGPAGSKERGDWRGHLNVMIGF